MRRNVMWILALVVACPNLARAHDWDLSVVVRIYTSGAVLPASPRALSVATTILEDAGVHVTWISCELGRHADAICDSLMGSTDLRLRMIRCDDDSNSPFRALGYALIDRQQHSGALATVYVDRVTSLARESGVDGSVLLGRALAHEIGHLLMGTNQHSRSGVMRARWTRRDLRRGRPDQWRFTRGEMMAMREHGVPLLMASKSRTGQSDSNIGAMISKNQQ
jgi:hypothetical protein